MHATSGGCAGGLAPPQSGARACTGSRHAPDLKLSLVCAGPAAGGSVLKFVCRVAIEPDTCVSKTQSVYLRYGPQSLVISKFLPWLGTLGPPLAGMFNLAIWRVLLIDVTGASVWAGAYFGPAGCFACNWKMSWPHYRDSALPSIRSGGRRARVSHFQMRSIVA